MLKQNNLNICNMSKVVSSSAMAPRFAVILLVLNIFFFSLPSRSVKAFVFRSDARRRIRLARSSEGTSQGGPRVEVTVFSDLAWPWCYVGMKNLDAAVEEFGQEVEVTWLPYIIDPGTAAGGEEYLAYNKRRWGSDGWTWSLKEQGRKVGAPFKDWQWWPNTLKAHCLIHFASEKGIDSSAAKAVLFEALYEKGANLSNEKVLADVASEKLGLPKDEVLQYLTSGSGEEEVLQMVRAGQDIVQGGVPFFIVRGAGSQRPVGFSGAQPSEQLVKIMKKVSGSEA